MEAGKEKAEEGNTTNQNEETRSAAGVRKGKSCEGSLYYSSFLKSKCRNPRCVGISRTLHQVPKYIVSESELEASKEGRNLNDFRYACFGYSVYMDNEDAPAVDQKLRAELPICVGIELFLDEGPASIDHAPAHAPVRSKEDERPFRQPQSHRPQTIGEEFLMKFSRNASIVASGVAMDMRKVGNYVKDSVDDMLYPYRRRSK